MDCVEFNLVTLPNEILVEILSYFNPKDFLRSISKVCRKLNSISKSSSLWKRTIVIAQSKEKLLSFCSFFNDAPYLLELSLKCSFELSEIEVRALNILFSKLKRLCCLNLENIALCQIILPPTVKHLNYCFDSERLSKCDLAKQFTTIQQLSSIEHLYLEDQNDKGGDFGPLKLDNLIRKYESTLTSMYLKLLKFHSINEQVSLFANCSYLKELGIDFFEFKNTSLSYNYLLGIAKLPSLEILYMNVESLQNGLNILLPRVLTEYGGFPELRHLSISADFMSKRNYDLIFKKLPKLEIFGLSGVQEDLKDLVNFIKSFKTLKHVAWKSFMADAENVKMVQEMFKLRKRRHFSTDYFGICRLIKSEEFSGCPFIEIVTLPPCAKCSICDISAYKCYCWLKGKKVKRFSMSVD